MAQSSNFKLTLLNNQNPTASEKFVQRLLQRVASKWKKSCKCRWPKTSSCALQTPVWQADCGSWLYLSTFIRAIAGDFQCPTHHTHKKEHEEPIDTNDWQNTSTQTSHYWECHGSTQEHFSNWAYSPSQSNQRFHQCYCWLDCLLSSAKEAVFEPFPFSLALGLNIIHVI